MLSLPYEYTWDKSDALELGFNIGLAGNILFIRTNTEINAGDFHNALAKLSSPNLAIIQRHSQQSKIRCKSASHHLATYIGYLIFDELLTERNFRQFGLIFTTYAARLTITDEWLKSSLSSIICTKRQ